MAITANKLLGKKEKGGALVVRPTTSLTSYKGLESPDTKKSESGDLGKTLFTIQKKIILVDDLLKGTFAEKKKRQKDEVKKKEDEARAKQEKDQEKPDKDDSEKETPKSLIPKLSFLDGIKKFISEVLVGWLTFNLINFLPQVLNAVKFLGNIADFVIEFGGKLLDGLVTFIDIGYDAYEKTSEWVGDAFGEDKQKQFENFASTLTKFLNVAIIAAMVGSKMGMLGMGADKGVRRGVINKGKRIIKRAGRLFDPKRAEKLARVKNIKKLRADRLKRVKKFGRLRKFAKAKQFVGKGINLSKKIVKTGGKVAQTVTKGVKTAVKTATPVIKSATKTVTKVAKTATKTATTAAKTAAKTATKLGKTGLKTGLKGLKALKKVVSPIVKKIPFIGALLDFALNYFVFKEPLGKSAFMAIGAGVGAWLGGILGTLIPVPFVGTAIGAFVGGAGGDMLAGALYDAIFKEKKPKEDKKEEKKKKTTKIEIKRESKFSMLQSGERSKIEQVLYEMRVDASKGSGKAMNDWVGNPKYEKDVDLIMKHGLQKVEIDRGRVTLQGNAENIIPLDVNSVAKKTNNISSYDDEEETIVIKSGSETGGDVVPETETKESITPVSVGGGGGDNEVSDALYKSG